MADLPITSDEGGTPVVITGAVSPYSTVAVASNGSLQTLADITGTGTITALNGSVVATTHGCGSVNFYITGVWVATISIQGTVDGTNWFAVYGVVLGTDVVTEFVASDVSLDVPCGGLSQIRLVATAFTSGTASINWNAGAGIKSILAISPVAASFNTQINGAVTTAAPTYTNGTIEPISLDTLGNIRVTITNSAAISVAQAAVSDPWLVAGLLTNNNAAPAANNIGVLPAIASSAAPTYNAGDQVLLSTDLSGNLRVVAAAVAEQNVNLNQINGSTAVTAATGVLKVGIVGNTGAAIDAASTQNVATPANGILTLGEFNTTPTTITSGNSSPLQLTAAANLKTDMSSWIGSTAPTVGQKTMANSIPVTIASDESDLITSLNALVTAKTVVAKTGSLVTTATTANQVVLTYTVTAGKTLYLEYVSFMAYITTVPGNTNPVLLGTLSLENPSGTQLITNV